MTTAKAQPLALIYVRVSTDNQVEGASLDNQEARLIEQAEQRGYAWRVVREEGASASDLKKRPLLRAALQDLREGRAQALYAWSLDRVSRSALDFLMIFRASQAERWELFLLHSGAVDHSTPHGEAMLTMSAAFAQLERDLIRLRTREALAQRKREGMTLGRPDRHPAAVVERVAQERRNGHSLRAIAAMLNAEGVAPSQGGKQWHASTVQAVLRRVA